jgi:hypothetical protein
MRYSAAWHSSPAWTLFLRLSSTGSSTGFIWKKQTRRKIAGQALILFCA